MSTTDTARKKPERPWTAARTMEVLRRCPLAIAKRLVHCAIAVSTAVLGQSNKDNVRCTAVEQQLEAKEVWANLKVQLHLPPLDLLIFLISPGTLIIIIIIDRFYIALFSAVEQTHGCALVACNYE